MAGPGRGAQIAGRLAAGDVAHHLQAHDAGGVVAPGLDLGGGGEDGDAARGAGRLVSCRGHAVEIGMDEAEEAAQQALSGEELADEIAHVAALDVRRFQIDGGQALAHHLGKGAGEIHLLARPVARKVALPATQDIDHALAPSPAHP